MDEGRDASDPAIRAAVTSNGTASKKLGRALGAKPRHAVVTGGASGIGRSVVDRLLARGGSVTVLDLDSQALDRLIDGVGPSDGRDRLMALRVDVTDAAGVEQAMVEAAGRFGVADRLVTCAGIRGQLQPALETDLASWRRVMDVHLFGTWAACRAFAGALLDNGGGGPVDGSVVTISSIVAANGFTRQADYGTAKAAVSYLTKVLAIEWAPFGIRVNAVAPGYTATPMVDSMVAEGYDLSPVEQRTPLGRLAEPDETARAVEFLLYDAGFVTGTVLHVDGGWTAVGR